MSQPKSRAAPTLPLPWSIVALPFAPSIVYATLVDVLTGREDAEAVLGFVERVALMTSTDHASKVQAALLLTETKFRAARIFCFWNTPSNYESVPRTAGVPEAVYPAST